MVKIYTGSNTTAPIGRIEDYNNTNPSRGIAIYRTLSTNQTKYQLTQESHKTEFAQLIYGNGPYNLVHPNNTTSQKAKTIDVLA